MALWKAEPERAQTQGSARYHPLRRAVLVLGLCLLGACRQEMAEQPKYVAFAPSTLWPDGASARPLVPGTVARGALERRAEALTPPPVTPALLARGRERYEIFCAPCHGLDGMGEGRVVARGFPQPPSYHSARLRAAPAQHFFDVITDGYGVMYSYAGRVAPADRWAIAAYIRALQLASAEARTAAAEPVR